jgi:hypothetical protein
MAGIDGYSVPRPVRPSGMPEMTGAARTCVSGIGSRLWGVGGALSRDGKPRQFHEVPAAASKILGHPKASAAHSVVPIFIENGQVIMNVMINGQGPFPMTFDTGGVEGMPSICVKAIGTAPSPVPRTVSAPFNSRPSVVAVSHHHILVCGIVRSAFAGVGSPALLR